MSVQPSSITPEFTAYVTAVKTLFATRPTLHSTARRLVLELLERDYPAFDLSVDEACIGLPYWSLAYGIDGAPDGYHYYPLVERVMQHGATGRTGQGTHPVASDLYPPLLVERSLASDVHPVAIDLDVDGLLASLAQLGFKLLDAFIVQCVVYWNAFPPFASESRWLRLASLFNENVSVERLPLYLNLTAEQAARVRVEAYTLQLTSKDTQHQYHLEYLPLIAFAGFLDSKVVTGGYYLHPNELLRSWNGTDQQLVQGYSSEQVKGRDIEYREWVVWRSGESADVLGENLSRILLENQIQTLKRLIPFLGQSAGDLQAQVESITDPLRWFETAGTTRDYQVLAPRQCGRSSFNFSEATVPDWLQGATDADVLDYAQRLEALGRFQCTSQGKDYLHDVGSLNNYATRELRQQMRKDNPQVLGVADPNDISLSIKVTSIAAPGGGIGGPGQGTTAPPGSSGGVRSRTLSEWSIYNISELSVDQAQIDIHRGELEAPVPDWMTADYLRDLITRVNIGERYSQALKAVLQADPKQVKQRKQLFYDELQVHLPLKALEYKIRSQHGLTEPGYRSVAAVVLPDALARKVEGREIVLRSLALQASASDTPDPVAAIFVIGPKDVTQGPHVLYRPLYTETPLQEFATWQALLEAIKVKGELQTSVFTWMTAQGRKRYGSGGLDEPHGPHIWPGDGFAVSTEKVASAMLSESVLDGDQWHQVFVLTAQALVDQGDRDSVSNREQRWESLKTAGSLVLNVLLVNPVFSLVPGLTRVLRAVGWLVMLRVVAADMKVLLEGGDAEKSRA